ncbi:ATP-dependent DNA ligase [Bradyrhizobium japonicum]
MAAHSKTAHYAGGLSVEEIVQQHREADRLNRRFGKDFRILKGIEADIWVEPKLLAEIEYRAKSAEGKVRHPFFKGLREDL